MLTFAVKTEGEAKKVLSGNPMGRACLVSFYFNDWKNSIYSVLKHIETLKEKPIVIMHSKKVRDDKSLRKNIEAYGAQVTEPKNGKAAVDDLVNRLEKFFFG